MRYVARYATSEAKLANYLRRKVAERGWGDDTASAPIDAIVARCVDLGFVDDRSFAEARVRTLSARGYGGRRVGVALSLAGIDRALAAELAPDAEVARAAAETYARRRRFGPFAKEPPTDDALRRQFAAMVRAGHDYELSRFFTTCGGDYED